MCPNSTAETAEQCMRHVQSRANEKSPENHWSCYSVFIINFQHIFHKGLRLLMLIMNR